MSQSKIKIFHQQMVDRGFDMSLDEAAEHFLETEALVKKAKKLSQIDIWLLQADAETPEQLQAVEVLQYAREK